MKVVEHILILGIALSISNGCKTHPMNLEDFRYVQEITDPIRIASSTINPNKYVYVENDTIIFKAEIDLFNQAIDSLVKISSGAYQSTYREMAQIINDKIDDSDSVNLDSIRTTRLIIYPLHELAMNGKLFVYDKILNEVQDLIWEKDYYGESLYQKKIRSRFYEGKIYTTKQGKEFLNVELLSGH